MRTLPSQVWLLMLAYALMLSGASLMSLVAGIVGLDIAASTSQATLPVTLLIIGIAATALPLGRLLSRYGRQRIYMAFAVLAFASAFF